MSKMWSSILEGIRILGNHSGCHQLPERSFFYKGYQFPVCARCTGVFFGHITAIIVALCGIQITFLQGFLLLLIMGFDWFIQYINLLHSNNIRRLITGFLGGLGLFSIYIEILRKIGCFVIKMMV